MTGSRSSPISVWSRVGLRYIRKMIRIQLESGREVSVEGFSFGYTYGGLLEGSPSAAINKNIVERTSYPSDWGRRKVLKIQPDEQDIETWLKPTHYAVWLNSSDPILPEYDGSELVVVWFGDVPDNRLVEEIIENGIKDIDWGSNAQDFHY